VTRAKRGKQYSWILLRTLVSSALASGERSGHGIVGCAAGRAERMGQMVFGQNTLDRPFAGHRAEMQAFEASLHSAVL
jgi:hypothetical protein